MNKIMVVLALIAGTLMVGVSPASAHANAVRGVAVCNTTTGMFDVTWTITNDYDDNEVATSRLGSVNIGPKGSATQKESVSPGGHSLEVTGVWKKDNFTQKSSGEIKVEGDCKPTKPEDTKTSEQYKNVKCEDKVVVTYETTTTTTYSFDKTTRTWVPTVVKSEPKVINKEPITEGQCGDKPPTKVDNGDWVEESHVCTDKTYDRTRTVTTTEYTWDAEKLEFVGMPVVTKETETLDNKEFCEQPPAIVSQTSSSAYECGDAFETKTTVTKTIDYVYDAKSDGYVMGEPVLTEANEQVPADVVDCEVVEPPTGVDVCPLPGIQIDADDCGEIVSPPGDENPHVVVTVTARTPAANAPVAASAGVLPNTGGTNMAALLAGLAFVFMGAFAFMCGSRVRKN